MVFLSPFKTTSPAFSEKSALPDFAGSPVTAGVCITKHGQAGLSGVEGGIITQVVCMGEWKEDNVPAVG